jgi:hypothetical protein
MSGAIGEVSADGVAMVVTLVVLGGLGVATVRVVQPGQAYVVRG